VNVVIPLFDRFTALDAIGPYEVLSKVPGATVTFAGVQPGPVTSDTGALTIMPPTTIDAIDGADVLVFPGGGGTRPLMRDDGVLGWVRHLHDTTTWTASVCTGSLVLGAAGVLRGLKATTHWAELETLRALGAEPTLDRVVEQGKVITAAGVSSGIDMALTLAARLAGDQVAQAIQLGIEYDPQPPFDTGSPAKAPAELVDLVRGILKEQVAPTAR
jgi:putative intracellular protease/amidase